MSMTKYMHSRNIYKIPPNFKQMAIDYPEFRKYAKQELNGKISINFKDPNALRALTLTLLEKDFGLKIDIPANKLIPTIPLRLNYLLWIEDLLSIDSLKENQSIKGLDIGTGASCVYPLIAAKNFGWSMIGTEVDEDSYKSALENVQRNNLDGLINVRKVDEYNKIFDTHSADFSICNPPFFASPKELQFEFKSRKQTRPRPKNAFTGNTSETISNGGEIQFISKMIRESNETNAQIRIYTTMIGCKSSLQPLKTLLRQMHRLISFKQTEFCQGNVTRWGLAWTYCDIDLRRVPEASIAQTRKQRNQQMALAWTVCETNASDITTITAAIIKLLDDLYIITKPTGSTKNLRSYQIIAKRNTWSNQRRKTRQLKKLTSNDICERPNNDKLPLVPMTEEVVPLEASLSSLTVHSPGSKRYLDDSDGDCGFYRNKRQRVDLGEEVGDVVVEGDVLVHREGGGVKLELLYRGGSGGKDALHQVLQYVKNNLKIDG